MTRAKLIVLLSCMALTPLAAQAEDAPDDRQGRGDERRAALDTDGDGAISQAEAQAGAPRLAERFGELDADGDGRLTKEEMQAARSRNRGEMKAEADERYRSADANGDGSIDLNEAQIHMPRAAEHFGEIDADTNGLLTREEMRSAMQAHRGQRQSDGQQQRRKPER